MIIPDATKRTVRLAIRVDGDRIVQLDRTLLPKIRSGTVGDLILPAADIINEVDRNALEFESFVPLLSENSVVFVGLSPQMMELADVPKLRAASELHISAGYCFAEVQMMEVLELRLRGYKDPCLEPCNCLIPILKQPARSLNHAFTLLSTRFETARISHSGNVFARAFYLTKKGWRPLNEARGRIDLVLD